MNNMLVLPGGIVIPLPLPPPAPTMAAFYYFLMAGLVCRSFFKKLDWEIQQTPWFKEREAWMQALVCKFLDFFHHWWMGYGLMVFPNEVAATIRLTALEVYWVGFAVLLDDLPDMPERIRKMFEQYVVFKRVE